MASVGMTELGTITAIIVEGVSVISLWLRLRWRVKQEAAHCRYVTSVLQALPDDTEIDEQRDSKGLARLTITRGRHSQDAQL